MKNKRSSEDANARREEAHVTTETQKGVTRLRAQDHQAQHRQTGCTRQAGPGSRDALGPPEGAWPADSGVSELCLQSCEDKALWSEASQDVGLGETAQDTRARAACGEEGLVGAAPEQRESPPAGKR